MILEFLSGISLGFIVGFLIMGKIVLMKLKTKGYSTLDSVPIVTKEKLE